jgi:hypothetical protein
MITPSEARKLQAEYTDKRPEVMRRAIEELSKKIGEAAANGKSQVLVGAYVNTSAATIDFASDRSIKTLQIDPLFLGIEHTTTNLLMLAETLNAQKDPFNISLEVTNFQVYGVMISWKVIEHE